MIDEQHRLELLERYARAYGEQRLAVAWTITNRSDAAITEQILQRRSLDELSDEEREELSDALGSAKVVRTRDWPNTRPFADANHALGLCKERGRARNPAIVVRASGLVSLESDSAEDLAAIEALGLPPTWTVCSSSNAKRHLHFRPPAELETLPVCAFRFEHGRVSSDRERYFLCPPSTHPSGSTYSFLPGHSPDELPLAELPLDAYQELLARSASDEREETEALALDDEAKVRPGHRRERTFRLAASVRAHGAPLEGALAVCELFNETRCSPRLTAEQVRGQVEGAYNYAPGGTAIKPSETWIPPDQPIDGAELLGDVAAFIRRYVVLPTPVEDADVIGDMLAAWVLHTWSAEASWATPYLRIVSATPESGKTLLLEILAATCRNGWHAINPSPAVLYRKVDKTAPTLLLDELDNYDLADRTDTLAVLNAGYKRGATVDRSSERGDLQEFSCYCPKAYAGLDERSLAPALLSRSITIRMETKRRSDRVDMWIAPFVEGESAALRARCEAWANVNLDRLRDHQPDLLELVNRKAEVWWALLAIGEVAGGEWTDRIRAAARALGVGGDRTDSVPRQVQLLQDIAAAFERGDSIFTSGLVAHLNGLDESPWGGYRKGKGLDARGLARLLRPFGIKPKTVRVRDETAKGYHVGDFEDAFERHLPPTSGEASHRQCPSQPAPVAKRVVTDKDHVTDFGEVGAGASSDAGEAIRTAILDYLAESSSVEAPLLRHATRSSSVSCPNSKGPASSRVSVSAASASGRSQLGPTRSGRTVGEGAHDRPT